MSSHLFEPSRAVLIPSSATALTRQPQVLSWLGDSPVVEFGGLSYGATNVIHDRFGVTPVEANISLADIRDSMGEWISVIRQSRSSFDYLVLADRYGYGSTYYSYLPGEGLLVSDTFEGVSSALNARGRSLSLNLANYVTTIASSARTFLNPMSTETMIQQVSLLGPDEAIEVTQSTVRLISRTAVGGAHDVDDYNKAIQAGIELSTKAIQQLVQVPDVEKRLTLSGGVDSRLALALLQAAGVQDEFSVFSMDPRTWKNRKTKHVIERDVQLANQLRIDAGMKWWAGAPQETLMMPVPASIRLHQKYKSNYYYLLYPSQAFSYFTIPQLTVRGGGGEILRSTLGGASMLKRYKRHLQENPSSNLNLSQWVASVYISWGDVAPGFKDYVTDALANAIGETDVDTFETHMNTYYFRTRNRAHFGHVRSDLQKGDVAVQLLSNPYFYQASQLISFEERAAGRLVKDIFNQAAPRLLDYAFEDEEWSERLANPDSVDVPQDDRTWREGYDAAQRGYNATPARGWESSPSKRLRPNEQNQFITSFVREGFAHLEELVERDARPHLEEQHDRVLSGLANGRFNANNTAAKMLSALESFLPDARGRDSSTERIVGTGSPAQQRNEPLGQVTYPRQQDLTPVTPFDEPVMLEPTLHQEDGEFIVECHLRSEAPNELSFAVYLYKDGERFSQSWYQDSRVHKFKNENQPGEYYAIAFARFTGRSRPTFQGRTASIKVNQVDSEDGSVP